MNRIESRARVGGDETERRNRLKKKIISTMRERKRAFTSVLKTKKKEGEKKVKEKSNGIPKLTFNTRLFA